MVPSFYLENGQNVRLLKRNFFVCLSRIFFGNARLNLPSAENDYALCDEAGEEKFSFKLKDAIERAKRGKVFAGKTFYVTPKVQADLQLLKNVIVSCGAQVRTSVIWQPWCAELSAPVLYDDAHSLYIGCQY